MNDRPQLGLLGGFMLVVDGQRVDVPPRGRAVIAYLALHGRSAARPDVAGSLWGELPEPRALANLRGTVWRLPHAAAAILEQEGGGGGACSALALLPGVRCDVDELREAFWALASGSNNGDCHAGGRMPVARLQSLAPLLVGDGATGHGLEGELLPGWYDEWVLVAREQLRELRLQALELAATAAIAYGWGAGAVAAALAAVAAEPLRERPNGLLVAAHLAEGDRVAAVQVFEAYCGRVSTELNIQPSLTLEGLVARAGVRRWAARGVGVLATGKP